MKTALAIVVGLLLTAGRAEARDAWTWQDTAWEAAFAAAVAVDIGQTRTALNRGYQELNPIVGTYPSQQRLVALAATSVTMHACVSALLPKRARRTWQAVTVGLELGAVGINYTHVGFRLSF